MAEELVSALLDGECSAAEIRRLLDETATSPQLMQQYSRMNLVREALSGKPMSRAVQLDSDQFCAGIMSRLGEMEPANVAAPATAVPAQPKVVALPTRPRHATPQRLRRSRPLIGWAAAASFTLIVLAGGRAWYGSGSEPAATPVASLAANSGGSELRQVSDTGLNRGGLMPVSAHTYSSNQVEEPTELRWTQLDPDTARELNGYMLEHNNSRADQGMNGALGYARLAARNVDYRSSNESH